MDGGKGFTQTVHTRTLTPLLKPKTNDTTQQIGLAQLPLAAVALRFTAIAFAACSEASGASTHTAGVLLFVVLLLGKLACAIVVTRWAAGVEQGERRRREMRAREKDGCSRSAPVPAVAVVNAP